MGLLGDETIIDLGCGDGRFIELLATAGGHDGLLVGINNFSNHYVGIQASLADRRNVAFLQGDIRHLSLRDESADWATINNVLYHVDQPLRAFNEALRVVKPGGHLLIATRNAGNQGRMWGFMKEITNELKAMSERGESQDYSSLTPPETFYNRFDMEITRKVMIAKGLRIKNEYMQSTIEDSSRLYLPKETVGLPQDEDQAAKDKAALETEDAWHWYRAALLTLHTVFGGQTPDSRDLKEAIDRVVKPVFYSEIATRGFFEEQVEQGFIIAQKPA
jgi:ubiquinone/menaquinone biosynthesis C-methylase UbiE